MYNKILLNLVAFTLFVITGLVSCSKSEPLTIPPARASFLGASSGTYFIQDDPTSSYTIPIGVSNVLNTDRTINISVTSPSGAQQGVEYNISSTTITIPAGKAIDSITINGLFSGFADGHVDTLIFAITGGSVEGLSNDSTYTLVLRKLCVLNTDNLSGNMTVVTDEWADYSEGDIIPVTKIDETHISFEYGAADAQPIIIAIDPSTNTTSVAKQVYGNYPGSGYGDFSAQSVAGSSDNYVNPCDNIISVRLEHTVEEGSFGDYVITLRKAD